MTAASIFNSNIDRNVIDHMRLHRQLAPGDTEAGGQLFARLTNNHYSVRLATGPYPTDRRNRYWIEQDKQQAQRDIIEQFENGLHYVGDWHTHPEPYPAPSPLDVKSAMEIFTQSDHNLSYMLSIIIGTGPLPLGISINGVTANGVYRIQYRTR